VAQDADPRELTAGFTQPMRGAAKYVGVLRDGSRVVWRCKHTPHIMAAIAKRCSEAELRRRLDGAQKVFMLFRCIPCGNYQDPTSLRPGSLAYEETMAGKCWRCSAPGTWVRVQLLDTQEAGAR
jgi:hypothetical protein